MFFEERSGDRDPSSWDDLCSIHFENSLSRVNDCRRHRLNIRGEDVAERASCVKVNGQRTLRGTNLTHVGDMT